VSIHDYEDVAVPLDPDGLARMLTEQNECRVSPGQMLDSRARNAETARPGANSR